MSIEIVNEAIAYTIDCPYCKSVLKFHREDITDCYPFGNMIECPVCKNKVNVASLGGELSTMVEPVYDKGVNIIGTYDPHVDIALLTGDRE